MNSYNYGQCFKSIKKIVDGDTLHFTNDKCRILYIDTPESYRNKKAKRDVKQCKNFTLDTMVKIAKQSTAHAKTLVKVGKSYKYDVTGKDRYNRSLCVVYTSKGIFNELMVKDGYAMPYERYVPRELKSKYNKLSKEAKSFNRGLWKKYNIDCIVI
ncbi:MAG: thermonuclease family protein [Sulfurimonas sp.]|nr:thermonuclease family protein [Sulfurimonas sp.]